jgi:TRAP-type uncharacterized transport system substrate-binding protein
VVSEHPLLYAVTDYRESALAGFGDKRTASACLGLCLIALLPVDARAAPRPAADPIQLSIGGGTPDSAAFRWSSALAETLSRPPGLPDCDAGTPCGVPNVVASAQTYDDSAALLKAVIDGTVTTAVLPALPLLRARCALAKDQVLPVAALKILYRQPLYIVTGNTPAVIAKPKDWVGKTVVVGPAGSDTDVLTGALLEAYGVPQKKVKLQRLAPAAALTALKNGSATVGVFLGHAFDAGVGDLIARGFKLMSLPDTPERAKLIAAQPELEPSAVPPGTYPGLPAISILAQPVTWVAGPGLNAALAGPLVAAVSEVHNQARLADLIEPLPIVPEAEAFQRFPVTPAEGAAAVARTESASVGLIGCPPAKH